MIERRHFHIMSFLFSYLELFIPVVVSILNVVVIVQQIQQFIHLLDIFFRCQ